MFVEPRVKEHDFHPIDFQFYLLREDGEIVRISLLIAALRGEIQKLSIPDSEKQSTDEIVDAVESQFSSGKPSKSVVSTLLKGLPTAASIASIGSFCMSFFG